MMTATECPNHDRLKALTLGQLSNEDSDALFQHINECDACRTELETVEDMGDSLIVSLRDPVGQDEYSAEPNCRMAVVKALGTLALSENGDPKSEVEQLPRTFGEYEIVRPIGSGGMGNVFLARHTKLGRQVALKVLASHRLADTRMLERFESEMRAVGRLSHPNIVTAHDAREVDGTAVLVTEFVSGLDLGQLLQRTGTLSIANACEIVRQVAVALAYTNSQGFVHRDIKPSNIMLSAEGDIKLLDLGLARLQYGESDRTEITGTGQAMGTADYVAPEQVTDSKTVDIRADIYALGCTLFKLLTGRAPFADEHHVTAFAKMTAHVSKRPPSLATILSSTPRNLVQLVDSMLAKKPEDRPQSPQEIIAALAPLCNGHDLPKLIGEAEAMEPRKQIVASTSSIAKPKTQSWMKRTVPFSTAIASGLLGVILGACLSIIVVITNPDGTKTLLRLAEGSKVEVRDEKPTGADPTRINPPVSNNSLNNLLSGQTPKLNVAYGDITPLSFGILVNRDSTGHSPSANEAQIVEATRLLRASDGSKPVRTSIGTWYQAADSDLGAPIKELNGGKQFVLVSDQSSIRWPHIQGQVLRSKTENGQREATIELELDKPLGARLAKLTKENIRNQLAIIVLGQVRSAPVINAEVGEKVAITGIFEPGEAKQLSQWLHGGLVDPLLKSSANSQESLLQGTIETIIKQDINPTQLSHWINRFSSQELQGQSVKTYPISGIETTVAKDLVSAVLEGKPNVKLMADLESRQLILFAKDAEHELVKKILAEVAKGKERQENQAQIERLKQQLSALEQERSVHSNTLTNNHPKLLELQNQIKVVQSQISFLQNHEKKEAPIESRPPVEWYGQIVQLENNLRQIGLAFHNFQDAQGKFPGTSNTNDVRGLATAGKKIYPYSWRVAILPYIDQNDLYQQYRFDEKWDSEHNLTLLDKMPTIYRSPFAPEDQEAGETNILGFASEDSALGIGSGEALNTFTDGLSTTLLLVETECTLPWTKPQDIPGDEGQARFFEDHPFVYLMADGSVNTAETRPSNLNEMISRNGGVKQEATQLDELPSLPQADTKQKSDQR